MDIDLSNETNSNGLLSINKVNTLLISGYKTYIDDLFTKLNNELKNYIDIQINNQLKELKQNRKTEIELKEEVLKLKEELFTLKMENMNKDIRNKNINIRNKIPFGFQSTSFYI